MRKHLNKKELAALIERVFMVNHKAVRFTRRRGRQWHVYGERTIIIGDTTPPTSKVIRVELEGASLLTAALGNPHLKAALEREAADHAKAQKRHEEHIAKQRKAA